MTSTRRNTAAVILAAISFGITAPAKAQYGPRNPGTGTVALVPLTEAEASSLRFMREEEKLARDVYQSLFQKWNLVSFRNISASEQAHFEAVGALLTRYGISDPAANTAPGVYVDATLTALYNDLMAKAMRSAEDALAVGVMIEKQDIADLESAIHGTDKLDVKRVYTNLMNASHNHLEAFETACGLIAVAN